MSDSNEADPGENESLLAEVEGAASQIGLSLTAALQEKLAELHVRFLILTRPNARLKDSQLAQYLEQTLRIQPSEELVESCRETERGPRLVEALYIRLEERQNWRCRTCGIDLSRANTRHVDHIIPVALRGRSEFSNYQILCGQCNLGKSKLLSWIDGAPFLLDSVNSLSARLRYCVLAYYGGQCSAEGCSAATDEEQLFVVPRVPIGRGGRFVFDNLITLCTTHKKEREQWLISRFHVSKGWTIAQQG